MADIIRLLSDAVANQIAAGEVIQRPASVVKELMENAVDAGADIITVNIKEAGKTLIQVIDNGCGMSETDARLCWERHATSKIREADDLFSIKTKGFRGEALASVAAIAEVGLKTRKKEDELGTQIRISASQVDCHEPVSCQEGSNFMVKNLFFNVPARRKFLKTNSTELRHIINEFNNLALAHPDIEFSLIHNNSQIYNLGKSNLRQRIINVFGKHLSQSLIPINTDTSIIKVSGFIGKPEYAKKTYGEQFFFVNKRFIRHSYLHKAVLQSYEQILSKDSIPAYFIYLETDPGKIDINIHPTKTEIKFEDEHAIWQIINAVLRESIGRYNLSPSLDFETGNAIEIPTLNKNTRFSFPGVNLDHRYNPFEVDTERRDEVKGLGGFSPDRLKNWEMLYGIENLKESKTGDEIFLSNEMEKGRFLQLKNRYILTPVKSGLMIIDQKRAHERIIYENSLLLLSGQKVFSQQTLFPETIELNMVDYVTLNELADDLFKIGFDVRDAGNNCIIVNGIPENVKPSGLKDMIETILERYKAYKADLQTDNNEKLAKSVAIATAIPYGKALEHEEMRELVDKLFGCRNPNYSPAGKAVLKILETIEIENIINKL